MTINIAPELINLRNKFIAEGFDIRFVGGCVRDSLINVESKDTDLCTDASPEQQIDIFKKNHIPYIETGLQHGTVTAKIGNEYCEITSLRYETNHDGRHAQVHYTTDWELDLSRRDLTINAMSMDMDGNVYDPFNGSADLKDGTVRFVGIADQRIKEDYLRILRFFRFHGRFSSSEHVNEEASNAIFNNKDGLNGISKERIWSEMAKILTGPNSIRTIKIMEEHGVLNVIGVNISSTGISMMETAKQYPSNAISYLVALTHVDKSNDVQSVFKSWKMSRNEINQAEFMISKNFPFVVYTIDELKYMIAVDGEKNEMVSFITPNEHIDEIMNFAFEFPVSGNDIVNMVSEKKQIGSALKMMRQSWGKSNYIKTKEELISEWQHCMAA